eukprot:11729263-Prorocentrum_lima.AAC.1
MRDHAKRFASLTSRRHQAAHPQACFADFDQSLLKQLSDTFKSKSPGITSKELNISVQSPNISLVESSCQVMLKRNGTDMGFGKRWLMPCLPAKPHLL